MHVDIEKNALYYNFDLRRQQLGFTTFKAAVLESMRLFLQQNKPLEEVKIDRSIPFKNPDTDEPRY